MLFALQRYKFFSKSQPLLGGLIRLMRCCLPCKGTNFLANHNLFVKLNFSKRMLFALQRYKFFSKSQPGKGVNAGHGDVVCLAKVQIF